jgi:large subunit ribosomal protein L3
MLTNSHSLDYQLKEGRRTGALAMKVGMIPLWDAWGERHATTVLHLDSCQVVQVKTEDTEGYTSMQLGVGEAKTSRVKTTAMGHFNKADVIPKRKLMEFRVTPDSLLPVGTTIQAMHFIPGQVSQLNKGMSSALNYC